MVKGGCPTACREFIKTIEENQCKFEDARVLLVVDALGQRMGMRQASNIQQKLMCV